MIFRNKAAGHHQL